jgi:hypothetical protein
MFLGRSPEHAPLSPSIPKFARRPLAVPGELRKRDTGMSATAETARRRRRREAPIFASSLGNALELYEILVYGYFAVVIAKVFFPTADQTVSLLVTLGSFGISFLARPVGAIFLGAYGDRKGRKNALTLSILLMIIGTGLMTIMPSQGLAGLIATGRHRDGTELQHLGAAVRRLRATDRQSLIQLTGSKLSPSF